jgi:hypothetical protein
MTSIRALAIKGEAATDQALRNASDEMADLEPMVRIYYAAGLLQAALSELVDGADAETRETIIRDVLHELRAPAAH